jgi:3(or 17)beta-hydroxysteroid dehydrogenase
VGGVGEEDMGRVDGKIAIISGGASGLGAASARMLAREGARVIIGDIDLASGRRVAEEIGAVASVHKLDVTLERDWDAIVAEAAQRWGRLDILVNSAGIVIMGSIEEATLEQFRKVMAVNLEGTFLGCRAAFKLMKRSGTGSIINLSSVAALIGTPPDIAAYTASKGGVAALTRSIAAHCVSSGLEIRCNAICPGSIRTPMLLNAVERAVGAERLEEALTEMAKKEPIGLPDDVANMVVYLASDESRFMNGTQLVLDKGFSII